LQMTKMSIPSSGQRQREHSTLHASDDTTKLLPMSEPSLLSLVYMVSYISLHKTPERRDSIKRQPVVGKILQSQHPQLHQHK
jgi:hypothetical protein